jgi:hypothetical protein
VRGGRESYIRAEYTRNVHITDFLWKKKSKNFLKERIPLFRDIMGEKIATAPYFRDAALKEMIFFSMPCWYPIWGEEGDKNKDRQAFFWRTGWGGGGAYSLSWTRKKYSVIR